MNFTLNILGTASALPIVDRNPSAHVLDVRGRLYLIDAGEGVQTQMRRMHLSFVRLEAIMISHMHGDHIFGLFGLLSTMGLLGRTAPLDIYAPSAFGPVLQCYLQSFGEHLQYGITHHVLDMKAPETIFETQVIEVSAFPLNHRIETYGFLIREKMPPLNVRKELISSYGLTLKEIGTLKRGEDVIRPSDGPSGPVILPCAEFTYRPFQPRSYAYCSDTAPFPELPDWVRGVDLLYHEATFPEEMTDKAAATFHSTTVQAATCALQAAVRRLVVGHYSSRCQDLSLYEQEIRRIFPDAVLGQDGMVIDLPRTR